MIASKPAFMLHSLRHSALPVVWMDADLQLRQYPALFELASWSPPRDVLLFNWQVG